MHGCTILCWTLEPKVKWRHGVLMSWLITRFMNWYGATDVVPPLKPKSESDMAEILFLGGTVMWKVLCCACKIKNKTIKRVGRLPYEDKHDHNWPTMQLFSYFCLLQAAARRGGELRGVGEETVASRRHHRRPVGRRRRRRVRDLPQDEVCRRRWQQVSLLQQAVVLAVWRQNHPTKQQGTYE